MRLLLICLQFTVLTAVIGASVGVASSLMGLGLTGAGTPAAVGAAVMLAAYAVASAYVIVTMAAPFVIVLGVSSFFAITSGYRILRWTRWLGMATNLCGAAYLWWFFGDNSLSGTLALFLVFCAILFAFIPKRPDTQRTGKIISYANILLWLAMLIFSLSAVLTYSGSQWTLLAVLLPIMALYYLPFHFNRKAVRHPLVWMELFKALSISAAAVILFNLLAFPFAIPLVVGFILTLGYGEMIALYPDSAPPQESPRYWLIKAFGHLPVKENIVKKGNDVQTTHEMDRFSSGIDIYWFSATGNTLHIAARVAESLRGKGIDARLRPLERHPAEDIDPTRVLCIAAPVFSLGLPDLVWSWINALPQTNKATGVVFIATYGGSAYGVIRSLRPLLERKGYIPLSAGQFVMPDSFFSMDRPEKIEAKTSRANVAAGSFADELLAGRKEWNHPSFPSLLASWLARKFFASRKILPAVVRIPRVKATARKCIGCGICAELCPGRVIAMRAKEKGKPGTLLPEIDHRGCQVCLRCLAVCPRDALYLWPMCRPPYRLAAAKELAATFNEQLR